MGGKIGVEEALQVSFMCYDQLIEIRDPENLWKKLKNILVSRGEVLKFRYEGQIINLVVLNHTPEPGIVYISENTKLFIQSGEYRIRLSQMKELYLQS